MSGIKKLRLLRNENTKLGVVISELKMLIILVNGRVCFALGLDLSLVDFLHIRNGPNRS
jgi:hypothetical protein